MERYKSRLWRDILFSALSVTLVTVILSSTVWAERPRIYAIQNVRVVTSPGQVLENATVVLRDGLIEAVGTSVAVPPDAQVIDGLEGWSVYPAFIDAASTIGQKPAEGQEAPQSFAAAIAAMSQAAAVEPGASHELTVVHPELAVVDGLDASDDKIGRHRKLGFGLAHSVPLDGLIKGQSAVIALRNGSVNELVVRDRVAQTMGLDNGGFFGGGYPSSKIGAMAGIRQALLDAERVSTWQQRYAQNPLGMRRPEFRSSDEALVAVLRQEQPVLFVANATLDHQRFRGLADEFDLRAMSLALGCEERPERLQAGAMPILLPLEFPKKPAVDKEDELRETDVYALQAYLRAPRLPSILRDRGVEFALVTAKMSSTNDFHKNLRKAIENGLTETDALAALTTVPASLLGISDIVGTLEAGKMANLLVVEGDLFSEKPKFHYLFVDGIHEEFDVDAAKGDPNAVVDPRGIWDITTEVMGRSNSSTWTIEGDTGAYKGFSESERAGKRDFESVEMSGDALTIRAAGPMGSLEFTVIVKGEELEGESSIDTPQGSLNLKVTGRRVSKPEGGER